MKDCNCCDGIYNSLDIHFTSACDNNCSHCIDKRFTGMGVTKPKVDKIISTIIKHSKGIDDVLFLGGEPCLFLEELVDCVCFLKKHTNLKVFVTTSIPKICYDNQELFLTLLKQLDGINFSVQHHQESIADSIRRTVSHYNRQDFYKNIPLKEKIRINLNIVKPYLSTKEDITDCLIHYDQLGFNSIKLSEIQHGKDVYTSFSELFEVKLPSAYSGGCQTYLNTEKIIPKMKTPLLLKRSCFLCEESLSASLLDGIKVFSKLFKTPKNKYGVIYGNGSLQKGWI